MKETPNNNSTITVRCTDLEKATLLYQAKKENRTLSNYLKTKLFKGAAHNQN